MKEHTGKITKKVTGDLKIRAQVGICHAFQTVETACTEMRRTQYCGEIGGFKEQAAGK